MKNGPIFRSKVCHFQYYPKFFFNREMGNIRACKELRLQLINLDCENSTFVLHFSSCLKMKNQKNQMGIVLPSHFHNIMKLEDSTHIKRYIFHYFL